MPDAGDGRSMRARMLAGEEYVADDPVLEEQSRRARRLAWRYNTGDPTDEVAQRELLRELLGAVGPGSVIRPPLQVDFGWQTFVGARVFVNFGLQCLDVARVEIGDDTQIGPNVQLLTPTHPLDPARRLAKWEAARPIAIGRNVWFGGGVIVCPGVTVGDDTVVGAGSVVTRDLPARVVAVGNPARVVKSLDG